jgi:hypothetical protein
VPAYARQFTEKSLSISIEESCVRHGYFILDLIQILLTHADTHRVNQFYLYRLRSFKGELYSSSATAFGPGVRGDEEFARTIFW